MREKKLINDYTLSLQAEEDLLRQKSRIQWLKAGDRNSSYFFKAINGRRNRSKIHSINGDDGSLIEGGIPVKNEVIRHFQNILGCSIPARHGIGILSNIIDNVISNDQANSMDRDVTNDEIRQLNATILSLVPKVPNPSKMKDFRPISCCNTLYKIIANMIKPCLSDIISPSQSAFVAGRSIEDIILLTQELIRNYHKDIGCPRIIKWIKACLTTPKFSVSFNDMEVLSKILAKRIADSPSFKFHWKCDKIKFSHLCFADDLTMLCHGSPSSTLVLKAAFDELSLLSVLLANQAKSNIFTSGLSFTTNQQLINLFGYTVGSLPIRYLGIPIISTKLCLRDCSPLVDKVSGRLSSWLNLSLSYAEQKFRSFLWKEVEGDSKGAKISWYDIYLPKKEGGLGIKDLSSWNKALMIRPLWILIYGTNNLWSSWIKAYHLKGSNLWEAKAPYTCSWNWRKLLHLRNGAPCMVYDSGLPLNAMVNAIVLGDSWSWPAVMSIDLVKIRSRIPFYNPNSNIEDIIRWLPSSNGIYSASFALASLRAPNPLVPWFKLV
ncbi:hypothetical protein Dsin_024678 [Dipteronia sinensis]|uniref:Reverse transcriptase domain-containing protein n=1 Tax=Dipteronia sinensis TaxID=43782 RepID=A0AAE0DWF8_9ROSI|nr:hypothetical protein Dsin_024678 [Dipteronia sinensis]